MPSPAKWRPAVAAVCVSLLMPSPARPEPAVRIGEPVIVAEGPAGERRWGYYQFPSLEGWQDGRIALTFHVNADAAESYGLKPAVPNRALSRDGGRTWQFEMDSDGGSGLELSNGDRLRIVTPRPFPVAELKLPPAAGVKEGTYSREVYTLYRLRDLPAPLDRIWLSRRAGGARTWEPERARLEDPQALRYSLRGLFPIVWWGDLHRAADGSVLAGIYPGYLEGQPGYPCNVFFYRSTDRGKTWKVQGRILYQPDEEADPHAARRDGFTEPALAILRDGTLLCVLRTTDGNGVGPMYQARSADLGRTWSRPLPFAPTGVLPRLLRLGNGALVLSSGRPGVDLRVSFDGLGRVWSQPYKLVPLSSPDNVQADSCGYTSLVALDDDRFLIAYSWFRRKGSDGRERKAILVRQVEVRVK